MRVSKAKVFVELGGELSMFPTKRVTFFLTNTTERRPRGLRLVTEDRQWLS